MFILEFLLTLLYFLLILSVIVLVLALAIPLAVLYLVYWILFRSWRPKKTRGRSKVKPGLNIRRENAKNVKDIIKKSMNLKNDDDAEEFKKEITELVGELEEVEVKKSSDKDIED